MLRKKNLHCQSTEKITQHNSQSSCTLAIHQCHWCYGRGQVPQDIEWSTYSDVPQSSCLMFDELTPHRIWLELGENTITVCNQPFRQTQPSHPSKQVHTTHIPQHLYTTRPCVITAFLSSLTVPVRTGKPPLHILLTQCRQSLDTHAFSTRAWTHKSPNFASAARETQFKNITVFIYSDFHLAWLC